MLRRAGMRARRNTPKPWPLTGGIRARTRLSTIIRIMAPHIIRVTRATAMRMAIKAGGILQGVTAIARILANVWQMPAVGLSEA